MKNYNSNECLMKMVTRCYRARLEDAKNRDIDRMMKKFQSEMKLGHLCFMVETNNSYMEAVISRVKFIEPMGYEMSTELIEGYVEIILKSKKET